MEDQAGGRARNAGVGLLVQPPSLEGATGQLGRSRPPALNQRASAAPCALQRVERSDA